MGPFNGRSSLADDQLSVSRTQSTKQSSTHRSSKKTSEPHQVQLTERPTNHMQHQKSTASRQSSKRNAGPKPLLNRTPSVQTRYMEMLLHLDQIPRLHNILASFFTWILLAGYIVFPGTFTSLQDVGDGNGSNLDQLGHKILHTVGHLPLLWIAGACCVIGAAGMIWLWYRWRRNYVWLINRIFLPGFLNSVAGLISTVVNVYTARNSVWSLTAKITAIVTGSCTGVTAFLFGLYNFWVLRNVRRSHDRDVLSSPEGETMGEKVNRIAHEPALEPGSVV